MENETENIMTKTKTTITKNGQSVTCIGEWKEDSTCICIFDDSKLDGSYRDGATSWEAVVQLLTMYARSKGTKVLTLEAI